MGVKNWYKYCWGVVQDLPENKVPEGLGFSSTSDKTDKRDIIIHPIQEMFPSAGFICPMTPKVDTILEDDSEKDSPNFVTHGRIFQNWITVDIPSSIHIFE